MARPGPHVVMAHYHRDSSQRGPRRRYAARATPDNIQVPFTYGSTMASPWPCSPSSSRTTVRQPGYLGGVGQTRHYARGAWPVRVCRDVPIGPCKMNGKLPRITPHVCPRPSRQALYWMYDNLAAAVHPGATLCSPGAVCSANRQGDANRAGLSTRNTRALLRYSDTHGPCKH